MAAPPAPLPQTGGAMQRPSSGENLCYSRGAVGPVAHFSFARRRRPGYPPSRCNISAPVASLPATARGSIMPPTDTHRLGPLLLQSRTGDGQALNALLGQLRPFLKALVRSWLGPDLAGQRLDSD